MDRNEKLQILQELEEKQLTKEFLIPLFSQGMGCKNVQYVHGMLEFGIDILYYTKDEFGTKIYAGIQVKAKEIDTCDISTIFYQITKAFKRPFKGLNGKKIKLGKVILLTSHKFTDIALQSLWNSLETTSVNDKVKCIDGNELVDLFDKYLPSIFWEEYGFFSKYFSSVEKEFETIKDVSAIGQREPIPLEEIYVSLKLKEKSERDILRERELKEPKKERLIIEKGKSVKERIFDADSVRKFEKVVIVGAPGSGKTTLLKHLALKSCMENLEKQERITVPILITLKQFSESGKNLVAYIEEVFEQFDFPGAIHFFEKDLKEGKCLLLFDGFDELATLKGQQKVAGEIEEFIRTYDKNRFIVTSRTAGYHDELKGVQKLEVLPFDDQQIEQFITNWFGIANPEKAESMSKTVKENERIRAIARTPLMIAIIAVIFEEDRDLPQKRVELYQRCVEVLLSKWDVQRRIKNRYDTKAKEKILRKVALEAHMQKKKSFAKKDLLETFSKYLPEVKIEQNEAEDVLKEIVERNALLKEISIGVYDFLHLSFQEYLVALELWRRRNYQTLLQYLYEPWWEEVVLLFAGFDRDATDLVLKIKEKEREDERFKEDIFYSNLMLMGKCIADADYTDVELKDEIVNGLWELYETREFYFLSERAMKILALIKPDSIIDSLIENLQDEDRNVRWRAAEALGEIGSEKAVTPLIKALTDEDRNVRESAAYALGRIGSEKAVNPLIKTLTHKDRNVRWNAAEALGRIGSEKAVDFLIKALTDEDRKVRWNATLALGRIGSEKAVNPLIKALTHKDSAVRWNATLALGEIGSEKAVDFLIKTLTHKDILVRWSAAYALGRIGSEKAVNPLIKTLTHKDILVRERAAEALGRIGSEKAVTPLIKTLTDEDRNVQERAAEALGRIGSEKAVTPLNKTLTHKDSAVRWSAAQALGMIGSEKAVDFLIKTLTDEDRNVRERAAEALGMIGSEKAVDFLIKALTDEDRKVRERAAEALGRIGSEKAVNPLIKALTHKDILVRERAAEALGMIGSEKAVTPLNKALTHKHRNVRLRAAEALEKISRKSKKRITTKNKEF